MRNIQFWVKDKVDALSFIFCLIMEYNPDFYKTMAWKRKRSQVLKRDGFRCQHCKRYGKITEATLVHHIKHYDEFPEYGLDANNLVSLCNRCHAKQHPEKMEKVREARRTMV